MEPLKKIKVEVIYANPRAQKLIALEIEEGATLAAVIQQSGILSIFPEISLAQQKIGIFSKPKTLTDIAHDGDRIEIYRPLLIDPKEARRGRSRDSKT